MIWSTHALILSTLPSFVAPNLLSPKGRAWAPKVSASVAPASAEQAWSIDASSPNDEWENEVLCSVDDENEFSDVSKIPCLSDGRVGLSLLLASHRHIAQQMDAALQRHFAHSKAEASKDARQVG